MLLVNAMKILSIFVLFLDFSMVFSDTRIRGKNILCKEFNEKYITNFTCSIKLKNRYTESYSLQLIGGPNVSISNLKLKMTSYYKFRTEFRPLGIKLEEDVCEFLRNYNSTKLLSLGLYKNLPASILKPCPLSGTRTIENLELTHKFAPPIMPTGEYRFDSIAYTNINGKETFLLKVQNFFECSEIVHND